MIRTIGHSTLESAEFVARCRSAGIQTIIDIRSHPTSKWERFHGDTLGASRSWLSDAGIGYLWVPELGGWSDLQNDDLTAVAWAESNGVDLSAYSNGYLPKGHITRKIPVDPSGPNWTNRGMLDFAVFTGLESFRKAADGLVQASQDGSLPQPALMCAEFVWWKCHRSQVADYLTWKGVPVQHVQPAVTMHADVLGNRLDRYPSKILDTWGPRVTTGGRS